MQEKIIKIPCHLRIAKNKMLPALLLCISIRMINQIKHLQSVFTNEDISTMPRPNSNSYPTMSHSTIHTSGVENLLRNPNPHKATGPDAIPAHLLCELSAEVAPALTFVFQMSLDTGQIPDDWRMAYNFPSL